MEVLDFAKVSIWGMIFSVWIQGKIFRGEKRRKKYLAKVFWGIGTGEDFQRRKEYLVKAFFTWMPWKRLKKNSKIMGGLLFLGYFNVKFGHLTGSSVLVRSE